MHFLVLPQSTSDLDGFEMSTTPHILYHASPVLPNCQAVMNSIYRFCIRKENPVGTFRLRQRVKGMVCKERVVIETLDLDTGNADVARGGTTTNVL